MAGASYVLVSGINEHMLAISRDRPGIVYPLDDLRGAPVEITVTVPTPVRMCRNCGAGWNGTLVCDYCGRHYS